MNPERHFSLNHYVIFFRRYDIYSSSLNFWVGVVLQEWMEKYCKVYGADLFIYRCIHVISFSLYNHCKTLLIVKASPKFVLNHLPNHVFYKVDMKTFVYLLTVMCCLCVQFLHVFAFLTFICNISNFTFSLSMILWNICILYLYLSVFYEINYFM